MCTCCFACRCVYMQVWSWTAAQVDHTSTVYICVYVFIYDIHNIYINTYLTHTHFLTDLESIERKFQGSSSTSLALSLGLHICTLAPTFFTYVLDFTLKSYVLMAINLLSGFPPWSQITTSLHLFH